MKGKKMHGTTLAKKQKRPLTVGRIKHLVSQEEKKSTTGATGYTLARFVAKPVAKLVDDKKIGPAEYMAAQEIFTAFNAITGGLWIKPQSLERRDRSYGVFEPAALVEAQQRYRGFVDHWSERAKTGDKTLQIVVAAVIDERPFYIIESDIGLRHGLAKTALIRGLRDYAARAGWVSHSIAAQWKMDASLTFKVPPAAIGLAMAAARRAAAEEASGG